MNPYDEIWMLINLIIYFLVVIVLNIFGWVAGIKFFYYLIKGNNFESARNFWLLLCLSGIEWAFRRLYNRHMHKPDDAPPM